MAVGCIFSAVHAASCCADSSQQGVMPVPRLLTERLLLVVTSVTKCTYSPHRINSRHAICGTHKTKVYKLQVK
ncbi:hypothetical protein PR002_g8830 [Phytophthora rubi]|uniref:Uncharacterized protein n=1 Tax=Phytophthora rubi TaxID=129364 RepID=A0A6A3MNM2_9STRA|nr:hypothetical protein PR002_g8830 [Phytophthora rubi]